MIKNSFALALLIGAIGMPLAGAHAGSLIPQTPVALDGAAGGFDYLIEDAPNHRIFGSHPGTGNVVVIDTLAGTAKDLPIGVEVNGVAVVKKRGEVVFAGGGQKVFVYDAKTLTKKAEVALDGPGDGIVLDPKNGVVYVDEDKGSKVWTFDTKTDKITGAIPVGGVPEFILYDAKTNKIYQNIKSNNTIQVIDPVTNTVIATWPTAPVVSPHGMAIDGKRGLLYTAGRNGLVAVVDMATGKVVGQAEQATGIDQIVLDAARQRLYSAGGGFISVVDTSEAGPKLIDKIAVSPKAHTLAVDSATGDVWIAFPDASKSYVQRLQAVH